MDNKFVVTTCRLHAMDKNKLLLIGYFEENHKGNNELLVELDNTVLSFEVEEKERLIANKKSSKGVYISKDYYLWVELPKTWRNFRAIRLTNLAGNEQQMAFRKSVAKLKSEDEKVYQFIDKSTASGVGFVITGWYVDNNDMLMQFYDESGNELIVDINKKGRPDVWHLFPDYVLEYIVGYEAVCKQKVTDKIKIRFITDGKKEEIIVSLKETKFDKILGKVCQSYSKARDYYQQFGMKATIMRTIDKLTKRDSISYNAWLKRHQPTKTILEQQSRHEFIYQPKISIVIPLYKTPLHYLNELIQSIKSQTYSNWELCLSDGSGENSPLTSVLKKYEEDDRIRVVYNQQSLQISENTNAALEIATGDFIAFADHDDLLAPSALYECVYELNHDQSIDVLYTDEDKIDMAGKEHFMPHFKTDFNIDMLCSVNYICHLFVVKKEILQKVGILNSEFDGAQDYDFVLRCVEIASNIKHIPKILYHWRAHKDSTAENPESKNYAFEAGARAIQAHYDRIGIKATVEQTMQKGIYRTKYALQENPLISIIIPNKDHIDDLDKCITAIEEKSSYKNYEFIIVENNSTDEKTFEYYKELKENCPRAKVVYWKGQGFNYPAINNYGVEHAKGEYILFLNNDTEIVNEDCLEELLGYCMRDDVGAVGARLYYEDGTIQHAGVIVGLGGIAGHTFVGYPHDALGYFGRIQMAQDYSAVTAACMMVKKSVFDEVQGFDERYAVAFNDVDFCMKIREAGYLIVYNPYAELNHYESKSRGYEDTEEKVQRFNSEIMLFKTRWSDFLEKGDPYYSPNMTLDKSDFSLNVQMNKIREM